MDELNYDGEKFYYRVFNKSTSRRFSAAQEVQRVHFESNERVEVKELQKESMQPLSGTSDKLMAFLYNQIRRPVINQLLWQGRTLDFANEAIFH